MSIAGPWGGRHSTIIADAEVFKETYTPPSLPHRMQQASILFRLYWNSLVKASSINSLAVIAGTRGRVGIGKTTLAKYTGRALEREARRYGINFYYVLVNVFGAPSLRAILKKILSTIVKLNEDSLHGFSVDDLMKLLVNVLAEKNAYILVILDEFQNMLYSRRESELYRLFRIYEEIPSFDAGRIGFLLVMYDKIKDMAAFRSTLPQIESQTNLVVELSAYKSYELKDILVQRAELGLQPGAVSEWELELIADAIGEDRGGDGSARRAIMALHRAALIAESKGHTRILETDVREALGQESPFTVAESDLRSLTNHQLLILKAVAQLQLEQGGRWVPTTRIQERYEKLAVEAGEKPRKKSQFHENLKRLAVVGLLERRYAGKGRLLEYRLTPELEPSTLISKIDEILGL